MKNRVAIGLSGGVDSSVAAALLIEQGYDVVGVYITCWEGPGCRSEEDRKDALDIALQLNIPFEHLDFQDAYKEKVYEYMISEYEAGRTPNPDVVCNREIKFGLFYEWAMKQGFDFVATGHYAQVGEASSFKFQASSPYSPQLLRSKDEHKDQTYFLHQLKVEQLEHILFPIGHLTKAEVREEAAKQGLLTAQKPDSTGVCFIGEVPMNKFLEERIKPQTGKLMFRDIEVGNHRGVWFYTIGQRIAVGNPKNLIKSGFDTRNLPHFYVVDKDIENNVLYVGTEDQLDRNEFEVGEVRWIGGELQATSYELQVGVRIRHGGEIIPAKLEARGSKLEVKIDKPVRGVAPGQAAVFYSGEVCLGGGVII